MYSATDSVKNYLSLCRVSNLPTVWTNVLTAVTLSAAAFPWPVFLILALSMSLFYSGGMCLNDICDIVPDRVKRPSRPLPSGKISLRNSILFTGLLFAVALALLAFVPFQKAIPAGLLLLAFIVAYDISHKGHPLTVFLMAGCRLMIFVVSSLAITGTMHTPVIIAGSVHFAYVVIISVVARYENSMARPFTFPLIPIMLACISLLDGILMAFFFWPPLLLAGVAGALLTTYGQKFVKGD